MPKHFDRAEAKRFRTLFEGALAASPAFAEICAEHGLTCRFGNGRFDTTKLTFNLDVEIKGAVDPLVADIARMRGFDATRPSKDGVYRIKAYKARASKPWVMEKVGEEGSGRIWTAADRWCLMMFHPIISEDASAPEEGRAEEGAQL